MRRIEREGVCTAGHVQHTFPATHQHGDARRSYTWLFCGCGGLTVPVSAVARLTRGETVIIQTQAVGYGFVCACASKLDTRSIDSEIRSAFCHL